MAPARPDAVLLLAYNLIREVIVPSAAIHGKQPRRLGFTLGCQMILASWMLLSTGSCSNSHAMHTTMLAHIAANEVVNRPGRIEPRVLKRRRHCYPLMQRPRDQLRWELGKTQTPDMTKVGHGSAIRVRMILLSQKNLPDTFS